EEKQRDQLTPVPWQRVFDFSNANRYSRNFSLDPATGEVCFGPAIRQPDGTVHQYGRIPPAGHAIRFRQYRYGGGVKGNVPAGRLQVLRSAIPYVDQVTNLKRAAGGRDQESLDEVKLRAQRELRAQLRAVTPEDYEDLAKKASRSIARAKCNIPQGSGGRLPPGVIEILLVPAVADSLRAGDLSQLRLDPTLKQMIGQHLDKYRLLTTTLHIKEPNYLTVKVNAEIVAADYSRPDQVRASVIKRLQEFLCPLSLLGDGDQADELMGDDWQGWPFGRDLYIAEIFSLIQRAPGVKHVVDVKLSTHSVLSEQETIHTTNGTASDPLTAADQKVIRVLPDTLLCSLNHEITIVELG
ncbi:MAG TPA: putative baseplate assembly protein, partial [Anaerolineae bacterium]|nr:putative baseplate assembly protein [Anaerolineae bacterium]